MIEYALRLTRQPGAMTEQDVGRLRATGFDDQGILDICQVVSYYNYVNRLADGLGVELEESWGADDMILSRTEFEAMRASRSRAGEATSATPESE
jgi:hypothetical protein